MSCVRLTKRTHLRGRDHPASPPRRGQLVRGAITGVGVGTFTDVDRGLPALTWVTAGGEMQNEPTASVRLVRAGKRTQSLRP